MLTEVLVQNSGTFADDDGTDDLTGITDGTIQVVDVDAGETVSLGTEVNNGNDVTNYDRIRLYRRDGDTIVRSPVLDVDDLVVTNLAYQAPQEQQRTLTIPSGPAGGDSWTIKIVNAEDGHTPLDTFRSYEVEVDDNEAAGDIVNKFAEAIAQREDSINGYEGSSVTPVVSSYSGSVSGIDVDGGLNADELRLEANDDGTDGDLQDIFYVAAQDFDPTIADTQDPRTGTGTYEQVLSLEESLDAYRGRYVEEDGLLGNLADLPTYAQSGGNYRILNFQYGGNNDRAINKSIDRQEVLVAAESAVSFTDTDASGTDDYIEFFNPVIV